MSTSIDQKSYLQKYLTGSSGEKKKKKKKNVKGKGFKIIDDDLDLSKLRALDGDELDILNEGEDAPQIAGIIDERPEELRTMDSFKSSSKWRIINQDDGFNSKLKVEEVKRDIKQVEKENELVFGKMYSDSEDDKKNDSDASPPRKYESNKCIETKKSTKHSSDSDFSPPRKPKSKKKNDDSDISPPRKQSNKHRQNARNDNSDSDISPPRRKRETDSSKSRNKSRDSDHSLVNKHPKDSPSNNKPRKYENDSDASPPRRRDNKPNVKVRKPTRWGHFSEEDIKSKQQSESPKSSNRAQKRSSNNTNRNRGSESDISPPRKSRRDSPKRNRSPDSDMSPPRKRRHNKESSSPNRHKHRKDESKRRHESDSNLSPVRKERDGNNERKRNKTSRNKTQDSDSDLSPPRKEKNRNYPEKRDRRRNRDSPPPTNKKMEKTLDGKKAGLQGAEQLKHENEAFRRREDEAFKNMTDEMSGRNAQIVSRKGKRETSEDRQKQKEKAERQKVLDDKYKMWSKGLKQIESQQAAVEDFIHEASKPLARYKDDRDLESRLKDVERQGDPMLKYMRERKREKGELGPEKLIYKGNFPPNRFNIRPGYRWDGVDRSNGYEKKFFEQQSKRKAQQEEVYKWSTEDL